MVTIIFDRRPMPAPRPRVSMFGTHNKKAYTNYKKALALVAATKIKKPLAGPVKMRLVFQFKKPKNWPKKKREAAFWHTQRPDADNLEKTVKDALNGIAYGDDSQVCVVDKIKIWGEEDMVLIELEEIENGG